jgi:hypothetical protein
MLTLESDLELKVDMPIIAYSLISCNSYYIYCHLLTFSITVYPPIVIGPLDTIYPSITAHPSVTVCSSVTVCPSIDISSPVVIVGHLVVNKPQGKQILALYVLAES